MAHQLEMINGEGQMVYSGKTPWHGLGKEIPSDLTPEQTLVTAGLDWTVSKQDMFLGNGTMLDQKALVRDSDNSVLSIVSEKWNPVQNKEAFEFFDDFVLSGNMKMHTAGSLKNGKMVWALAEIQECFDVFGGDQIDSYLLFSNPHEFGKGIDIRFTPIRVVCNNTLTYAISGNAKHQIRLNHCHKFDPEMAKTALGISRELLKQYKEQALFLGKKRYTDETLKEYFQKLYPNNGKKENRNIAKALELVHTQPGAEFAEGSFWQAFNTITYMTDHIVGRNVDTRLASSWYGQGAATKDRALKLAIEMAEAD